MFEERLEDLDRQLREQQQSGSNQPTSSQTTFDEDRHAISDFQEQYGNTFDLSDLENALDILNQAYLTHTINFTTPSPTPSASASGKTPNAYETLSKYHWQWDPVWKEFYVYLLQEDCFLYLTRWKQLPSGIIEHVSQAHRFDLTPEQAALELGAWEDWHWDVSWKEFCTYLEREECLLYASRWRRDGQGFWRFVRRM